MFNNKPKSFLLLCSAALLNTFICANAAHAQNTSIHSVFSVSILGTVIYKTIHEDGSITYSDKPSPGAIEIELKVPTNTIPSNNQPVLAQTPKKAESAKEYTVKVLQPENEATIRNNLGEMTIAASLEPRIGGVFQLNINGQIHESATGMFMLTNMDRGAYAYTIKFIDNSGKVIASTQSRNVYLHKASALIN